MEFKIDDKVLIGICPTALERKKGIDMLYIPDGVLSIGASVFEGADYIKNISFPRSVYKIERGAFHRCIGLTEIEIPDTILYIEDGAFSSCMSLKKVKTSSKKNWGKYCFNCDFALEEIVLDGQPKRVYVFPNHSTFGMADPTECSNKEINLYKGYIVGEEFPVIPDKYKKEYVYFAELIKDDIRYTWYDIDMDMAITGVYYQSSGRSYVDYFNKEFTPESTMSYDEYEMLTGACFEGSKVWIYLSKAYLKLDVDRKTPLSLQDVLMTLKVNLPSGFKFLVHALNNQANNSENRLEFIDGHIRYEDNQMARILLDRD